MTRDAGDSRQGLGARCRCAPSNCSPLGATWCSWSKATPRLFPLLVTSRASSANWRRKCSSRPSPGVSSFAAAAASTGSTLAEEDETLAVIPAAYGVAVIDQMLDEFDTLVLLKVKPLLDEVIELLERRGPAGQHLLSSKRSARPTSASSAISPA
jgi:hypothetical protein